MKKFIFTFLLVISLAFSSFSISFAAVDQDVTIVNPVSNSSLASNNLLISVKITQPKKIKVSAYEVKKKVGETKVSLGESDMKSILEGTYSEGDSLVYLSITDSENFTTDNKLSFYTKKLENINPGVYLIRVDTISQEKVVYTSRSYVTIKSKTETENNLFDSSQSGTAVFLQNLLKSIFGNDN